MRINLTIADIYPPSFIVHHSSLCNERLVGRTVRFYRHSVLRFTNSPNNFRKSDLPEFMTGEVTTIMDGSGNEQGSALRVRVHNFDEVEISIEGHNCVLEDVRDYELDALILAQEALINAINQKINGYKELKDIAEKNGGIVGNKWLLRKRIETFVQLSTERGTPPEIMEEGIEKLMLMID